MSTTCRTLRLDVAQMSTYLNHAICIMSVGIKMVRACIGSTFAVRYYASGARGPPTACSTSTTGNSRHERTRVGTWPSMTHCMSVADGQTMFSVVTRKTIGSCGTCSVDRMPTMPERELHSTDADFGRVRPSAGAVWAMDWHVRNGMAQY